MASYLLEEIKSSIEESALRLIAEYNKSLVTPDELIRSLQSHAEKLRTETENILSDESDFGPSEGEAVDEVIRDFFYKYDFGRLIASANQASLQNIASQVEKGHFDSFIIKQVFFRKFCEAGDIPDFDRLADESDTFVKGVEKSDDSKFLRFFDSSSPRLVGPSHVPKELIGNHQIDLESIFSIIRPKWPSFVAMIVDELSAIEEDGNLDFAENFHNSLIECGIEKVNFRSLYQVEQFYCLKQKTLNATKVRGGITDLIGLMREVCHARFQHLFLDAWQSLDEVLDKNLVNSLKNPEWLQHFDPFTALLSAPNVSFKVANEIGEYAQDAIVRSEELFSDLNTDLEHFLKRAGWIVENGPMVFPTPPLMENGKIGDLTYERDFSKAKLDGETYNFTPGMQQTVLRWLIEQPGPIAEADLCQRLRTGFPKSKGQFKSLRDSVFKNGSDKRKESRAWGELIIQRDKMVSLVTKASELKRKNRSK